MFSLSPSDKSCVAPENCSSGRNNGSSRFPVGITTLGEENQQIRIQLAVHKYNSSPLSNRCAVVSPVRHSFLKNSLKAKNYEGDAEGTTKSEKKNGNQYEGVGAFPTIHLKKRAVRYRPIRRFNDVKIPYPELPVNRFMNHLPEVCSDLKSSTRSVLDVLEDLSGKKIHTKEENGSNKPKLKGLGGDYLLNSNAVYKPLFVQKPKICSVLTRDNTTQTLSPVMSETPSPQSSHSITRSDASDPKAELRKKLAKQNNEIYASLSSSISSSFAVKRKIDKVLPARVDDTLPNGSASKKSKTSNLEPKTNCYENGDLKSTRWKTSSVDSNKPLRKSKPIESSSPASPNKDRLTKIFLDMQNTSPKVQMFPKATPINTKSDENDSSAPVAKDLPSMVNGNAENPPEKSQDESGIKSSIENESKKSESEQPKQMFNFPFSKVDTKPNDVAKTTSVAFQFGMNTLNTFSFSTTLSNANTEKKQLEVTNAEKKQLEVTNTEKEQSEDTNTEKKQLEITDISDGKPNLSAFKFGSEGSSLLAGSLAAKDKSAPTVQTTANTLIIPAKPSFSMTPTEEKKEEKVKTLEPSIISPQTFSFGQKLESPKTTISSNFSSTVTNSTMSKNLFSFGQVVESPIVSTAPVTTTQEQKPQFSFDRKPDSDQNKMAEGFAQKSPNLFSFGQKSTSENSTLVVTTSVSQPATTQTTSLFGQTGLSTATTTGSQAFPVKTPLFNPPTQTSTSNSFGFQTSVTTQSTPTFGVSSSPQTGIVFGTPTATQSTFGASNATPIFGVSSSISTFGVSTTTPSAPELRPTSQSIPAFATSSVSQPTSNFGVPSTTQSAPAFGVSTQATSGFASSSTVQSTPSFGFGVSSSTSGTAFGAPTSTQSGFGVSTSPSNSTFGATTGFGTTSSTQPSVSFGSPATSTFPTSFSNSKPTSSHGQTGIFGPTPTAGFSTPAFNTNQSGVFGEKPSTDGAFDQNKIQTPAFGAAAQPFGNQNKFLFGMSTSNPTGFTTSSPITTATTVFSFGSNSTSNTFTFGSNTVTNNTQSPFSIKSPTNEPFKFGATATTKDGPGFGGPPATNFTFYKNPVTEQKPTFNFGGTQTSSSAPFTFGTTPSPSVFSFGGSTSSASSGSTFSFGTPNPVGPLGQAPTGTPFAVPGTFSIGSGSSQSRPRATSRPRRRP